MKIQHVFRVLSVCILVLVCFAATQPAFAESPGTHGQLIVDATWSSTDYPGPDSGNPCNIPLTWTSEGYLRINYLEDERGWNKWIDIYGTIKETLSGTNGKVIKVQIAGPVHHVADYVILGENRAQETLRLTGAYGNMTIPGYGTVQGGAGNIIVVVTWDTTNWDWVWIEEQVVRVVGNYNWDHWDIICSYLGGALK